MSFKHKYIIEDKDQSVMVNMVMAEQDFSEIIITLKSDKEIKGKDLANILLEYATLIFEETKTLD